MLNIKINEDTKIAILNYEKNEIKINKACSLKEFYEVMYKILGEELDNKSASYELPFGTVSFSLSKDIEMFKIYVPAGFSKANFILTANCEDYANRIKEIFSDNNIEYVSRVLVNEEDDYEEEILAKTDIFYPDRFYNIKLMKQDGKYVGITVHCYFTTNVENGVDVGKKFISPFGNVYTTTELCIGVNGTNKILDMLNSDECIKSNNYTIISSIPRLIESYSYNFDLINRDEDKLYHILKSELDIDIYDIDERIATILFAKLVYKKSVMRSFDYATSLLYNVSMEV